MMQSVIYKVTRSPLLLKDVGNGMAWPKGPTANPLDNALFFFAITYMKLSGVR